MLVANRILGHQSTLPLKNRSHASRHRQRGPLRVAAARGWQKPGDGGAHEKQTADHYATLCLPRGASEAAIKAAFRSLQKRYHPDNNQGDAVKSAELNLAYRTLTDRNTRAKYDAELRRSGLPATPMRDVEGLVGPVAESGVLLAEALPECGADACDVDGREEMIQFVRQWGATLTWSGELPLPMPLQCDEVPAGCRLGFVTVRDGSVCLVGELRFTVVPAEQADSAALSPEATGSPWLVTVRRQGATGPLPGEERILKSFRAVCRHHRSPQTRERKFQLSGVFAAVAAGFVGGIPFLGGSDRRTYEGYHLKRTKQPAAPAAE